MLSGGVGVQWGLWRIRPQPGWMRVLDDVCHILYSARYCFASQFPLPCRMLILAEILCTYGSNAVQSFCVGVGETRHGVSHYLMRYISDVCIEWRLQS